MKIFVALSLVWVLSISLANGARILAIFHINSYSHFIMGHRILEALAIRGHDVTFITPFEEKVPVKNLRHIVLTDYKKQLEVSNTGQFARAEWDILTSGKVLVQFSLLATKLVLNEPSVQKLLNSDETFDLVIYEKFLNEAFSGFAYRYNSPCITTSGVRASRWSSPQMGNPTNPSYIPDLFGGYSSDMNFYQRLYNSLTYLTNEIFDHVWRLPQQNKLLQEYFPGSPHVFEMFYNVSLMFVNSHVSVNPAVPLVPNMIEIGGYHIQEPKKLPDHVQEYLDNANDGVILFSMGSFLKSKDMPVSKRAEILRAFAGLKQQVLWKWEENTLPQQPANVRLDKWLPQQDVLAHPKVRLLITHGGLLSIMEAVYHGVPVLGIPIYGDQGVNIKNAENEGYGLGVPYNKLNQQTLNATLHELLTNSKYLQNAKRRSKIMRDQPTKPLDRAVYWVEYVLRHNGARHLKTAALNLAWYQYLLLDVAITFLFGLWLVWNIIRVCGQKLKRNMQHKNKKMD